MSNDVYIIAIVAIMIINLNNNFCCYNYYYHCYIIIVIITANLLINLYPCYNHYSLWNKTKPLHISIITIIITNIIIIDIIILSQWSRTKLSHIVIRFYRARVYPADSESQERYVHYIRTNAFT